MTVQSTTPGAAAQELARREHTLSQRVQHLLHQRPALSPAIILLITVVSFTVVNSRFSNPAALSLLVQQTAVVAALAVGQTLIILSTMVMATLAAENGWPAGLALAAGIILGLAAGALNGVLVTRIGLPPFIVTLGTLSIFTAIALLYSSG